MIHITQALGFLLRARFVFDGVVVKRLLYNFESAQTDSFSLHKIAERKHINLSEIEDKYDQLEKQMLTEFFKYAKEHKEYKWIHWNMRDMNYGFKAIENRYLVLGGTPFYIPDTNKIDLSRLLIQYYGV